MLYAHIKLYVMLRYILQNNIFFYLTSVPLLKASESYKRGLTEPSDVCL